MFIHLVDTLDRKQYKFIKTENDEFVNKPTTLKLIA